MKLDGKVALVTGAGSGIGRAIAKRFASEGAKVAVNDVSDTGAHETVKLLGGAALAVVADVSDSRAVAEMFARVKAELGCVDVLVNNAGIAETSGANLNDVAGVVMAQLAERMSGGEIRSHVDVTANLSDADWKRMLAVHLDGTFFCTREALKHMIEASRGGSIVNMSSVAGLGGLPTAAAYSAAKAGILGLTRSVAAEVGSRKIRVNAICPGYIDTPMTAPMKGMIAQTVLMRTPLGRMGLPDEIASVALFLASADADFVTGQYLSPNGGLHMG